jgi:hypothetical protein
MLLAEVRLGLPDTQGVVTAARAARPLIVERRPGWTGMLAVCDAIQALGLAARETTREEALELARAAHALAVGDLDPGHRDVHRTAAALGIVEALAGVPDEGGDEPTGEARFLAATEALARDLGPDDVNVRLLRLVAKRTGVR